jgi:indolepyruvate ferredoxin oxidoreductase
MRPDAASDADHRPAPVLTAEAHDLVARIDAGTELRAALELRVPELIAFQNVNLAAHYVSLVDKILEAEKRVGAGRTSLSVAVAKNLYKLMAYKDEYEVARLLLDDAAQTRLKNAFGPAAKVTWHLHPTFLRKLGIRNKIQLGPWFTPVLTLLRWAKWVRGTPLDLFGRTRIRAIERALLAHYTALLDSLCQRLTAANYDQIAKIAALPDMIRGYEDVKLRNVEDYVAEVQARCAGLTIDPALDGLPIASPAPEPARQAA